MQGLLLLLSCMRSGLFFIEILLRAGILTLGIWMWSQPGDYFDNGEEICYWKRTYGVECPGCGLTRGTQHMLHGEWATAMEYNPLSAGTAVLFTAIWLLNLWGMYRLWRHTQNFQTPAQRHIGRFLLRMGFLSGRRHPSNSSPESE